MRLTAGQGFRRSLQCQVVETDIDQETETGLDLLNDLLRDFAAFACQCQFIEKFFRRAYR